MRSSRPHANDHPTHTRTAEGAVDENVGALHSWRGQDLNLRPSGYEIGGHRLRLYALGRISPAQTAYLLS